MTYLTKYFNQKGIFFVHDVVKLVHKPDQGLCFLRQLCKIILLE